MKKKNIKKIDNYLGTFQSDLGCSDEFYSSLRKQIKREYKNSLLTIDTFLRTLDINPLIQRTERLVGKL